MIFTPAIRAPLFLDDYFQTSMIEGTYPVARSPFDLYNFVGDADRKILLDRGLLPWWSHPRITVRFFRPLSSALLYADHRLFGLHPLLFHLHSFLWWAVAALGARALYRRAPRAAWAALLGIVRLRPRAVSRAPADLARQPRGAGLGGARYPCPRRARALPRGGAPRAGGGRDGAVLPVAARRRVRRQLRGLRARPRRSPARRGAGQGRRAVGLLSFAAPAAAYLWVRARLGYGAAGSGFYHDPFRDPWAFLQRVPRRLGTLLAEGWLTLDPDTVDPTLPGRVLAPHRRLRRGRSLRSCRCDAPSASLDDAQRGHARWLLLGSLLSLAPVLAVMPDPRVLGASMLGIAATVGLILDRAWFPGEPSEPTMAPEPATAAEARAEHQRRRFRGLVALGLGFAHLVHGPALAFLTARHKRFEAVVFAEHAASLRERLGDMTGSEVVLVRGLLGSSFVLPYALDPKGTPPARWRILALTWHVLVLRRDPRTIEVVAPRELGMFPSTEGNLFRGEGAPFAPGSTVRVPGMLATVLEVGAAGPFRVRFEFDEPLETPPRVWINDRFRGIEDATPPEVGFGRPFDP